MHVAFHDQLAFHLTGRLSAGAVEPIAGRGLLPALFAPYRDLAALRHDFPLVLSPGAPAQSLSGLFDAALADAGDGEAAERLRGHAGRMERALRRLAAEGAAESLAEAWEIASACLIGADPDLSDSLDRLHPVLTGDGALAGCDRALAARLLKHEWGEGQSAKLARLRAAIGRLAAGLEDILRADFAASPEGRRPERLRAAIGPALEASFDFDAMARLLDRKVPVGGLDAERRRRITWLLTVLRTQRYAPLPGSGAMPYGFAFASGEAALEAWRERLPAAAELARAIAMARLEVAGEYNEAEHDALFAGSGNGHAGPWLNADGPSYLVCLTDREPTPDEAAQLLDALGAGLPFKVLVQTDDLLAAADGVAALGLAVRPLAATALSLGDVYVLQAGASQLFGQLARIQAGLACNGPALFSVYSGAGPATADLPPYLASAAAVESRAFPAFAYDPGAGPDWAARFSLDANPQAERDWPVHALDWEDAGHQRQGEMVAFTLVDFLACDRRLAAHLARIAPDAWNGHLVPVAEALTQSQPAENRMPCLAMADAQEGLHKVLADEVLLHETGRCLGRWHVLQELGGIHSSYAARQVEAARREWATQAAPVPPPAAEPPPPVVSPEAVTEAEPEPERDPDVPCIESARCTTCNECINVNNRMFGYDVNRKATIIDATAGTFRQLVEAAENCQVSIIHPGKPRDPNEPGLAELLTRAAPFL
jgi:hypothetical protein